MLNNWENFQIFFPKIPSAFEPRLPRGFLYLHDLTGMGARWPNFSNESLKVCELQGQYWETAKSKFVEDSLHFIIGV